MVIPSADALPSHKELKRYFIIQKICFAAIGMDPTSAIRTILNHYLLWIPNGSLFAICFTTAMYASQHFGNMNLVTDALAPTWQASLGVLKLILFLWNRKAIVELVRKIWLWNLQATSEEFQIIIEENRRDTLIAICFYCSVFFTGILALLAPFVIAFYYTRMGFGFWEYLEPPLKAVYFMDPKASYLGYIIAYIWDALAIYAVFNTSVAMDTLFLWLMHNISGQFLILNLQLKSLGSSKVLLGQHAMTAAEDTFRKTLINCVRYHQRVIDTAHTYNDIYRITVFVKFAISFIQIAFLAFQISRGDEFAGQLFHLSFLVSVSMQLMLYCYSGQRITDASLSVATTIYECFQWQDLSANSKRLLMLPLMRAQKPCFVTGVFFVADLNSFVWVFKSAGSIITMLMSLDSN